MPYRGRFRFSFPGIDVSLCRCFVDLRRLQNFSFLLFFVCLFVCLFITMIV